MKDRGLVKISIILFLIALFSCDYEKDANAQFISQENAWYSNVLKIPTPEGFVREKYDTTSFKHFLELLPLKSSSNEVLLYNGTPKYNQSAQFAVIKMDVGNQDLQQCADAVIRLRGEYLYKQKKYSEMHFCFLSDGKPRYYKEYCNSDYSYKKYRKWMNYIFSYANTGSLIRELVKVKSINELEIGDVFIQSGHPYGHAIIVVDLAKNKNGEKVFLLAQSYMPAQEIHILKNPNDNKLSPWYNTNFGESLITPEWTFGKNDLFRFPE